MLPPNILKSAKCLDDAVVLEAPADQDGVTKDEDIVTVTICLGPGSYATACAPLSRLFPEFCPEKEFCDNSQYLWQNLTLPTTRMLG